MNSLKQYPDLRPGDIIGFSGANVISDCINLVTYGWPRWSISHVGIVATYPNDVLLIFESTTEAPDKCYVQNAFVTGTQAQLIEPRISHYNGRVWHYPLVKSLRPWESKALTRFLVDGLGRRYDAEGAQRAAAKLWAYVQAQLHPESQEALFCSEWVCAAHRFIERFDTTNLNWSPNALIREEQRRGILGKAIRLK
jgi:hypothetical protein